MSSAPTEARKAPNPYWKLLLLLPFLGLAFPQLYSQATPALWGFPFFYWYQFAWVAIESLLLYLVYKKANPRK
ncbi:DUF3311 domain-containing protein [Granulicella sp. WH15]|uniref:DUF3311 domain-containing protein n=1 Tax=Granulicella sp. WH15 TaxID=2602070 RepID=UPI001366FD31|nr:DUF3311 domain-containing protein [Granulicella sp. WH15]QHN03344.1 DUF3311 domain-containing protein [Granulicella sp. WH15]